MHRAKRIESDPWQGAGTVGKIAETNRGHEVTRRFYGSAARRLRRGNKFAL
mgnify:CR=1 FL=1